MNGAKPKLVIFSHICSQSFVTGAEKLLLLITREMLRRFQCVLVVPQEGEIADKARAMGIKIAMLDIPLCISLYTAAPTIHEELAAMKKHPSWSRIHILLEEELPSCVLVNTSVHPLPALASKALGIPTVWMLMETIMDRLDRKTAVELISANSDIVAGISHTTLKPVHEHAPQSKTFMLPPYMNRDELLPNSWPYHRMRLRQLYGWGEHHRVAGFLAATIYRSKGLEQFIDAMLPIAASERRMRFLVLGKSADDAYYRHCLRLAAESGYSDRFIFLPFAEHIQHIFPVMDVVVVPSLVAEGFGMTALEGLVFGKGVVAFSSGGLTEILQATGNRQYLVPPGDVAGLTERVNALLSNDELRLAVGERNMAAAQQAFGVDAFRQRLDALIEQLPPPMVRKRNSLWRGSGPTVYLVEHGVKQPFGSEQAFLQRGYAFEDVSAVPDEELQKLPSGPTLLGIGGTSARGGGKLRRRRAIKSKRRRSVRRRGRSAGRKASGRKAQRRRR